MIKKLKVFLLIVLFSAFFAPKALALSDYVLPYPSSMPGSIFYKLDLFQEKIKKYWYFGNFGQFSYNLKQSDKYLVEAKTLLEYKQYLLGYNALNKSNEYYEKTYPNLYAAKKEGKNISEKLDVLKQASLKHIEVLEKVKKDTPSTFNWIPEKAAPTTLNFGKLIDSSIELREENL